MHNNEIQYGFSANTPISGVFDYADVLWWKAMLVKTSGSDFWPPTPEDRVLALLQSIFGYTAASLAIFFIEQEAAAT